MPSEKIDDFLNCYFDTFGIDDEFAKKCIRNGIINRYKKYSEAFPKISVNDDNFKNYIIKDENGYYQLEDFLLNRLFQGLRYIIYQDNEDAKTCEYKEKNRTIYITENAMKKVALTYLPGWPEEAKNWFMSTLMQTVFDHELGHALKTMFTGGYKVRSDIAIKTTDSIFESLKGLLGIEKAEEVMALSRASMPEPTDDLLKKFMHNLTEISDGKYKSIILKPEELIDNYSYSIGCGIHKGASTSMDDLVLIDELLQDTESMDNVNMYMVPQAKIQIGNNGNYINNYYRISGYSFMHGYGKVFISLLGDKDVFQSTYLDPRPVIEKFNLEYQSISNEVFQNNLSPFANIGKSLQAIKERQLESDYLQLDLFFAKCYSQMIMKRINSQEEINAQALLAETSAIQERLTTNDDETIRNLLPHVIILNDLKNQLLQYITPEFTGISK